MDNASRNHITVGINMCTSGGIHWHVCKTRVIHNRDEFRKQAPLRKRKCKESMNCETLPPAKNLLASVCVVQCGALCCIVLHCVAVCCYCCCYSSVAYNGIVFILLSKRLYVCRSVLQCVVVY